MRQHPDLATAWQRIDHVDGALWLAGKAAGASGSVQHRAVVMVTCEVAEQAVAFCDDAGLEWNLHRLLRMTREWAAGLRDCDPSVLPAAHFNPNAMTHARATDYVTTAVHAAAASVSSPSAAAVVGAASALAPAAFARDAAPPWAKPGVFRRILTAEHQRLCDLVRRRHPEPPDLPSRC